MVDRIGAKRLYHESPKFHAIANMIANLYLEGDLTIAEIRAAVTAGLELGMMRDTRPLWVLTADGERRRVEEQVTSAIFCEHANENPQACPCPEHCYCKAHTCRNKP